MIADDLIPLAAPIDDLVPLAGNPRRGDVDAVMKSYERFGQRKPIVARKNDKMVIAGNHQLEAAKRLGWTEIAVVWVDDDEDTAMAFALADNRIADLGTYDDSALLELLMAVDLDGTGYTTDDLSEIMTRVDLPPPVEITFDDNNGPGEHNGSSVLTWGYLQWRTIRVRVTPEEVEMLDRLYDDYKEERRSDVGFGYHLIADRVVLDDTDA